jgi:hypothetical protein
MECGGQDRIYAINQLGLVRNSLKFEETPLRRALTDPSRKFPSKNNGSATPFVTLEECLLLCNYLPEGVQSAAREQVASALGSREQEERALKKQKVVDEVEMKPEPGYVYAAFSDANGFKVGHTCKKDPMQRVRALNIASATPFSLWELIRCGNPEEVEKALHANLEVYSVGTHDEELFDAPFFHVGSLFNKLHSFVEENGLTEDDNIDVEKALSTLGASNLHSYIN